MTDKLIFIATLAGQSSKARWLSCDSEGETRIVLEAPASEIANVIRLQLFAGKAFKVTIEEA